MNTGPLSAHSDIMSLVVRELHDSLEDAGVWLASALATSASLLRYSLVIYAQKWTISYRGGTGILRIAKARCDASQPVGWNQTTGWCNCRQYNTVLAPHRRSHSPQSDCMPHCFQWAMWARWLLPLGLSWRGLTMASPNKSLPPALSTVCPAIDYF
ncbi:hypothetical protein BGW36DRAFT_187272 [Talaromyces proteolyticus]|uniref:Uncharacterized protein n=1 Tax=Talaromyces proteolyticus TaxID=1131652 RepID=A0AAD4KQ24_9EURO|nr:uncharacterized protein BGW36DRAFT_187272 [Talaromyces proteolyticus]KAH8696438.1 hypothetical protein BGW36DRAFT_187272 [Talaromyces proteolyticus]